MSSIKKALIYKDIKELFSSKQIWIPMIIVPLVLSVILPIIMIFLGGYGNFSDIDQLLKIIPMNAEIKGNSQRIIYIVMNYIFPVLFLIIPIMSSSIIGASSIVGEKERKTLETILYTPIDIKELFLSKAIGILIPSYIVTVISFFLFGIVINIGGIMYFGKLIFPNVKWLILLFWLCPAITTLGLLFIILISAKASNFQESQQMVGFIVIPVVLLMVGQGTGLFLLDTPLLLILGACIILIDIFLFKKVSKSFSIEKLI
ncbi:ABC transporter permease protein [Gottschalkia purinilytica]|uniref:ABC transporter permease protein n=1 Tax=Gottschalkia purinilytica TaxID=1503 RepID=A0A0L0W9S0_GOTPU|nr:ABC transporter permease subunit [Gottschalkia purinilytica]KNF08303.1 ABC transporter permease protein [Gottschalkia purinilytica]